MRYEDRLTISTPEGVDLEMTLAGLGSRFIAAVIDAGIQFVPSLIVIIWATAGTDGRPIAIALATLFLFLVAFGYDVLFETLASGRTPGKRAGGIRVVRLGGGPVTFTTSAVRNLLRLVDVLPFAYAAGIVSILVSPRNQRLGDMAAGTLVVRERRGDARPTWAEQTTWVQPDPAAATWDVSAVTADEVVALRRFLDRRYELPPEARGRLAWELTERLLPKVAGVPSDVHPEYFVEQVVAVKISRS